MLSHADCQGCCRCCVCHVGNTFVFGVSDEPPQKQLYSARGSPRNKRVPYGTNGVSAMTHPDATPMIVDTFLSLKLSSWKNDLPSEIDVSKSSPSPPQPHILMLHMTYHWLIILLHRPFYRRRRSCEDSDGHTDHTKVCVILPLCSFR